MLGNIHKVWVEGPDVKLEEGDEADPFFQRVLFQHTPSEKTTVKLANADDPFFEQTFETPDELMVFIKQLCRAGEKAFGFPFSSGLPPSPIIGTEMGKRQPGTPIEFVGWICGNLEDEQVLRELGVQGKMIWRENSSTGRASFCDGKKEGIFEYCTISLDIVASLMAKYPAFWPGCFTGLREDGEQTIYQPLWKMGHDKYDRLER